MYLISSGNLLRGFYFVVLPTLVSTSLGKELVTEKHEDLSHVHNDQQTILQYSDGIPKPPTPESIEVIELPLPPVSSSRQQGACTKSINPRGTGCIAQDSGHSASFQAGDFTPDGGNIIATVEFVGAPAAPHPASLYDEAQIILIKTDGDKFSNGDPWKCLSCGIPPENAISMDPNRDYPHVFRSGDRAIWGHNILDCDGEALGSDECTPDRMHIYPIYWPITADGSGRGGNARELRLHPDDSHIGWSSFTDGGQNCYLGRLEFNPSPTTGEPIVPRYDIVDVNLLSNPDRGAWITTNGSDMYLHPDSINIGELRGFSGSGDEITYIGAPTESNNIDLYAIHIETGVVRRLTSHPDYADPVAFSADDKWLVTQDTRATERQMWMSGMRGIPPIIDMIATTVAASTRNNGPRRFFQPILIDRHGDRGDYYGQQINADGDGSAGSVNDPNWNGRADPAFSLDSTCIVYWQSIVTSPSCGGSNPLPCPVSTAQGGREYRVMLARLTERASTTPAPIYKVPKQLPWAIPFPPGSVHPQTPTLKPGNYSLQGAVSGYANVRLIGNESVGHIAVNYTDYSDDGHHILDGWEDVELTILLPNFWNHKLDWYSDIIQTGVVHASKKTSPQGFHVTIDAMTNIFAANGTLVTTIDGKVYHQPESGT